MAEGVPVVQKRTDSGLAFIGGHHLRLELARTADQRNEPRIIRRDSQRVRIAFKLRKQRFIENHPGLQNLGQPAAKLPRRQRGQKVGVDQYLLRLVKRADQVFTLRDIHAGLSADTRIDHGQQRGRNLDEPGAAHIDRRRKPGHIADHTAAQCDKTRFPVETKFRRTAADTDDRLRRLMPFPGRKHEAAGLRNLLRRPAAPQFRDAGIGHEKITPPGQIRGERTRARPDHDFVGPVAESDLNPFHHSARSLELK